MILSAIVIPWWSLSPYYFPQKENMSPLEKIINILPGRIVRIFGYFNILHNMTQPYLHLFTVSIKSHDLPTFSVQQLFLIFSHSFLKHLMFSPCFAPCFPFQNAERRHHSPPPFVAIRCSGTQRKWGMHKPSARWRPGLRPWQSSGLADFIPLKMGDFIVIIWILYG